ncbi:MULTISPECIES: UbiA family prenyltransferase [unclassified Actinotalea]|uniref:UbiA family prenyltransferase n=1 Tax=unclassified Actinotalea TaxID=2638618 RepID=UPI0015F51B7B|nr:MULTISPECIES: UbiA family prenyltransferase [unclassified Actinotalea]
MTAQGAGAVPARLGRATLGRRLEGLVRACHPGPTVVVTAISLTFALGAGAPVPTALLATAAVLAGQLSIGWSNDWLDAGRDLAVGRRDKPVVAGLVSAPALRTGALLAAAACVGLSLATGAVAGFVHVAAVASGWAYNAPLKRTVASFLPYTVSFALLPLFLVLAQGRQAAWWVIATGALLGAGAHVANVLPDLEADAATGVRGLPHRLGRTASGVLAPSLLVGAVLVVVLGPQERAALALPAAAAATVLALCAGALALGRPASRLPFRLTMVVAALCAVLLTASGGRAVVD